MQAATRRAPAPGTLPAGGYRFERRFGFARRLAAVVGRRSSD
jgi:hypothetical protein